MTASGGALPPFICNGASYRWTHEGYPPGYAQVATTRASQVPSRVAFLNGGVIVINKNPIRAGDTASWKSVLKDFFAL